MTCAPPLRRVRKATFMPRHRVKVAFLQPRRPATSRAPAAAPVRRRCAAATAAAMVGQRLHRAARHGVPRRRRHRDHGAAHAAAGLPRVRRRAAEPAGVRRQGGLPRAAPHPGAQRVVGRGQPGDRLQALRQPRHRRSNPARADRAEHQGRRPHVAGRSRAGDGRAGGDRAGRPHAARGDRWRHHDDHQRRSLRRRQRHADPQPGRGGDPVLRRGARHAVGRRR